MQETTDRIWQGLRQATDQNTTELVVTKKADLSLGQTGTMG